MRPRVPNLGRRYVHTHSDKKALPYSEAVLNRQAVAEPQPDKLGLPLCGPILVQPSTSRTRSLTLVDTPRSRPSSVKAL